MNFQVFIPARTDSTRVPRKLYLPIDGKSVIEWTWRSALKSQAELVTIVCKDFEIRDFCQRFGARTCMTDGGERNGTEAIAQASNGMTNGAIIVNVQGDDCFIPPRAIDECARLLSKGNSRVGTMVHKAGVKGTGCNVVFGKTNEAIYFSRSLIPGEKHRGCKYDDKYGHLGVYAYRPEALRDYLLWPPADCELHEGLEQNRWLYYGEKVLCGLWEGTYKPGINEVEDVP